MGIYLKDGCLQQGCIDIRRRQSVLCWMLEGIESLETGQLSLKSFWVYIMNRIRDWDVCQCFRRT